MGNAAILAATSTSKGNPYLFPIIIVALFGLLYFVMIRPQRNRQRQAAQTQNQVVPGQRVRTTAGMYATVTSLDGDDVVLEVAPGVNVRYMRRAIMGVVPDDTGDTIHSDGQMADTGDTVHSDGQADGSGPATGKTGTTADATEDGTATT
jgi:preprotein translocase subunit YajC